MGVGGKMRTQQEREAAVAGQAQPRSARAQIAPREHGPAGVVGRRRGAGRLEGVEMGGSRGPREEFVPVGAEDADQDVHTDPAQYCEIRALAGLGTHRAYSGWSRDQKATHIVGGGEREGYRTRSCARRRAIG